MASAFGSIVGGIIQSNAASDAQSALERAAARARRDQNQAFERQVQLQAPFRAGGLSALNRYLTYFGLETPTIYAGGTTTPPSLNGPDGKPLKGQALVDARRNMGQPPELSVDPNDPNFGKYSRDFGMSDFQADPGYAFRLSEGMKALDASAAARGGLLSGNTLRGAVKYGQDAASEEYTNAFNRYQANRRNQLGPLETLFGGAHDSANTLGGAASNLGNSLASNSYQLGNVQAAGEIARGNAWTGAVGGVTDALGGYNFGSMFGGGVGGGYNMGSNGRLNRFGG
jgi:hypothetical protein